MKLKKSNERVLRKLANKYRKESDASNTDIDKVYNLWISAWIIMAILILNTINND